MPIMNRNISELKPLFSDHEQQPDGPAIATNVGHTSTNVGHINTNLFLEKKIKYKFILPISLKF